MRVLLGRGADPGRVEGHRCTPHVPLPGLQPKAARPRANDRGPFDNPPGRFLPCPSFDSLSCRGARPPSTQGAASDPGAEVDGPHLYRPIPEGAVSGGGPPGLTPLSRDQGGLGRTAAWGLVGRNGAAPGRAAKLRAKLADDRGRKASHLNLIAVIDPTSRDQAGDRHRQSRKASHDVPVDLCSTHGLAVVGPHAETRLGPGTKEGVLGDEGWSCVSRELGQVVNVGRACGGSHNRAIANAP